MLKRRIIPLLLWSDGKLVKTVSMNSKRIVGDPVRASKVYSDQDADEILIVDISKDENLRPEFFDSLRRISLEVMIPITVGGGVVSVDSARQLFDSGADKVLVNTSAYSNKNLLSEIAGEFGTQALVVGIDFDRDEYEQVRLFSHSGSTQETISMQGHLKAVEESGAGEIFLQSKTRDGTKIGLDLATIKETLQNTSLPLVACGGVGSYTHLLDAFREGVDGVGCGSLFNFGDNNPIRAKAYLRNHGINLKKQG